MGIYYDLFLEGLVGDEWRCLSPSFATSEGGHKLAPVMSGQSVIGAMLQEIGCWQSIPGGISKPVKHVL